MTAVFKPSIARRAATARGLLHGDGDVLRCSLVGAKRDSLAVRAFTHQVALATTSSCMRYSQRLQLLAMAQKAGISRFEANLIIAAIEHRTGHRGHAPASSSSSPAIVRLVGAALLAQVAILATAWLALLH